MESLSHLQTLVTENMYTIGLGLLVAILIAAVAWYWMSRRSGGKSDVLVNQARINATTTEPHMDEPLDVPVSAASPEPMAEGHEQESE